MTKGQLIGWEGRRFDAYFWFVGWDCLSLGLSVCLSLPNIEIHIPFGFIRIGRSSLNGQSTNSEGE
jgi:hypothetical protein